MYLFEIGLLCWWESLLGLDQEGVKFIPFNLVLINPIGALLIGLVYMCIDFIPSASNLLLF